MRFLLIFFSLSMVCCKGGKSGGNDPIVPPPAPKLILSMPAGAPTVDVVIDQSIPDTPCWWRYTFSGILKNDSEVVLEDHLLTVFFYPATRKFNDGWVCSSKANMNNPDLGPFEEWNFVAHLDVCDWKFGCPDYGPSELTVHAVTVEGIDHSTGKLFVTQFDY